MEEAILATLEGMIEAIENGEEPMVFQNRQQDTPVILISYSSTRGRVGGSKGGRGGDEPTESEPEPSYSKEEEEDE